MPILASARKSDIATEHLDEALDLKTLEDLERVGMSRSLLKF
jgi:hypothetical protein